MEAKRRFYVTLDCYLINDNVRNGLINQKGINKQTTHATIDLYHRMSISFPIAESSKVDRFMFRLSYAIIANRFENFSQNRTKKQQRE